MGRRWKGIRGERARPRQHASTNKQFSGGQTITFPSPLESGSCLEFRSLTDRKAYDAKGELIGDIKPQGQVPQLEAGDSMVTFVGNTTKGLKARANVTIISQDDKFLGHSQDRESAPPGSQSRARHNVTRKATTTGGTDREAAAKNARTAIKVSHPTLGGRYPLSKRAIT